MLAPAVAHQRRFQLVLIKPSHYDDDGYVIQWMRSGIPSNSLASLYALAADAAQRQVLGPDVAIDITAIDETNTRVRVKDIIALLKRHDGFGMVGLVGVQSNQFPRALDIARPFRQAGVSVVIGGFHVSGCIAMLPEMQADLQVALDMGCSLFAGEAEDNRIDQVLQHAANGSLQPIYNYMDDLPALEVDADALSAAGNPEAHARSLRQLRCRPRLSVPMLVLHHHQCARAKVAPALGRRYRTFDPPALRQGFRWFFVTDDNFARNKDWEAIFDRIIALREREGIAVKMVIQVDTMCHKIPNFVDKAARAGVRKVFLGLENINPANLLAAKKRQNKITEYRKMILAWKAGGRHHLCRLHPRIPGRHTRVDPRGHRDHQEGTAARYSGILLPDAAAGIGGSQGALAEGHRHGSRHEQIRSRACRDRARENVAGAVGRHLRQRVEDFLYAGSHRNDSATRGRIRRRRVASCLAPVDFFQGSRDRANASAANRSIPPPLSARSPLWHADRAGLDLLSQAPLGDHVQERSAGVGILQDRFQTA